MIYSKELSEVFNLCILDYHILDRVKQEINNPYNNSELAQSVDRRQTRARVVSHNLDSDKPNGLASLDGITEKDHITTIG